MTHVPLEHWLCAAGIDETVVENGERFHHPGPVPRHGDAHRVVLAARLVDELVAAAEDAQSALNRLPTFIEDKVDRLPLWNEILASRASIRLVARGASNFHVEPST